MKGSFNLKKNDVAWEEARSEIYYRLNQYEEDMKGVRGILTRIEDHFIKDAISISEIKQSVKIWSLLFGAFPGTICAICAIIVIIMKLK